MTEHGNGYVPKTEDLRRSLAGLDAADVVMLLRQCLELRNYDHALSLLEALEPEARSAPSVAACEAVVRFVSGDRTGALALAKTNAERHPAHVVARVVAGEICLRSGDRESARAHFLTAAERYPDYPGLQGLLSVFFMPGPHYRETLARIHQALQPRTYLEIGIDAGATLALAKHSEVAVGVEPAATPLDQPLAANARVVRLESDAFFAQHRREDFFGSAPVDLVFIDGMHLFEYALRDFANAESWCGPDSCIVMHDCLPILPVSAERERKTRFWVGDTWKAIIAIARERPELEVRTLLAPPSGLVVIRNLDPRSTKLHARMTELVRQFEPFTYDRAPGDWPSEFRVVTNDERGLLEALPTP